MSIKTRMSCMMVIPEWGCNLESEILNQEL